MADFRSIDAAFTQAVDTEAMPGIVAMAATDKGVIYEGAFGKRDLSTNTADDARHGRLDRVHDEGDHRRRRDAARRAGQAQPGAARERDGPGAGIGQGARGLRRLRPAAPPPAQAPDHPASHLLTHTAGFSYEIWRPEIARYQTATGTPGITTCANAALATPLLFDPGDRFDYGINIDWVGKIVEAASGGRLDRIPKGAISCGRSA